MNKALGALEEANLPTQERQPGTVPVYGSNGIDGWHNKSPLKGPGVITGRSGSIGFVHYEINDFWPLNTTLYVRDFHGNEPRFVARLLESLNLSRFSASTGVPSLNRNFVHPTPVLLPPLDEQQQIVEILDAADKSIAKTEALVVKIKQLKAGLLHDLLTRGFDEGGHLRDPNTHPEQFKGSPLGRIPREWQLSSVDCAFDVMAGFTLGTHRVPRKHKRLYLRVANVLREKIVLDDIAELEAADVEMMDRTLQKDDLLIVEGHANPDEIGRCACIPEEAAGLTFQNHLFRLRCKGIIPRFALAWLNGEWVRAYWRRLCVTSSGLNTINRTMLKALPVPIPNEKEQLQIAAALGTYDTRIRAAETYRDKLKRLSKASCTTC